MLRYVFLCKLVNFVAIVTSVVIHQCIVSAQVWYCREQEAVLKKTLEEHFDRVEPRYAWLTNSPKETKEQVRHGTQATHT